jgi:glycosyltransferase involved in cell wall biosynthesis
LPATGSGTVNRIVAAMGWLDAVVNCHSGPLNAAAASLRKLGVKTVTHLHLLDHSPLGRSCGHAMIALAYEHAYDLIVCDSGQLTSWMHAAGIPHEKLVHVPNAPGHSLDEPARSRILARRSASREKHLNALFLGRLDRQKGIDRLAALIERTQQLELPVRWRIVGAPVTEGERIPAPVARFLEPPVFESEALIELFAWADVLILLSDYEGVPLSVLEAQRAGVVVIATRVGALAEVIDSGRTGFLVETATAVEETAAIVSLLSHSRGVRAAIAAAASNVIDWPQATGEFIGRLTRAVDAARQSRAA